MAIKCTCSDMQLDRVGCDCEASWPTPAAPRSSYTQNTAPDHSKRSPLWDRHKALKYVGHTTDKVEEVHRRGHRAAVISGEIYKWIPK